MHERTFEQDLIDWQIRRDEQRAIARSPALKRYIPPPEGRSVRDERIEDHLRTAELEAAFQAARSAEAGPAGEPARARLRLLAPAFLDRAVVEPRGELSAYRASLSRPEFGFRHELVHCPAPDARREIHGRWVDYEARLEELRFECRRAADVRCQAVGAASVGEFLAATHAVPPERTLETFERGALEPLDERVGRCSRDRRLRSPVSLSEPEHPADSPVLATLAGYADRFPRIEIPSVLRVMGAALGADPDAGGPELVSEPLFLESRAWRTRSRRTVLLGALNGPGALTAALCAWGGATHAAFVEDLGGLGMVQRSDQAFHVAAGVLFGRLVLSEAFRRRFGPRAEDALDLDLRLELALAPRRSWTYVYLALRGRSDDPSALARESERTLQRALGRPAAVNEVVAALGGDPGGAAEIRGIVLALLLEERLRSRYGHEWFLARRAGRFLRECWEAEAGQTAESVADALDLGTIEPTPILDGCRP